MKMLANIFRFIVQGFSLDLRAVFPAKIFTLILLTGLTAAVNAQDSDDVIRVDTELVPFEVTVTDRDNQPVRGL